jgi:hypothetical protein
MTCIKLSFSGGVDLLGRSQIQCLSFTHRDHKGPARPALTGWGEGFVITIY